MNLRNRRKNKTNAPNNLKQIINTLIECIRCARVHLTHLERFVAFSRFGRERIHRIGIRVIYEEWNIGIFNWIAHKLIPPLRRTCIRIIQSASHVHGVSTSGR